jgi:hypothetical protein
MTKPLAKILISAVMAAFAVSAADAATTRKKPRLKRDVTPAITRDHDGTPIIMQGYRVPRVAPADAQPQTRDEEQAKRRVERPVRRGSSTYIQPPVPSPGSGPPGPPPLVSAPGVYQPPRINTFSDRVTNCIHSFPLAGGLGNNPTDQQAYVRQCAN